MAARCSRAADHHPAGPRRHQLLNRTLRLALAIWAVGYLVVACGPVLLTDSGLLQGVGLLAGLILLVPWIVGIVVLGALVWLTNPRR